jgi:hypothetical protein
MSRDFNRGTFLVYGYHSSLDYQAVKRFYIDYFEFHNAKFKCILYDMESGKGKNYRVVCGGCENGETTASLILDSQNHLTVHNS